MEFRIGVVVSESPIQRRCPGFPAGGNDLADGSVSFDFMDFWIWPLGLRIPCPIFNIGILARILELPGLTKCRGDIKFEYFAPAAAQLFHFLQEGRIILAGLIGEESDAEEFCREIGQGEMQGEIARDAGSTFLGKAGWRRGGVIS